MDELNVAVLNVESMRGRLICTLIWPDLRFVRSTNIDRHDGTNWSEWDNRFPHWNLGINNRGSAEFVLPHLFVLFLIATLAALPWIRWQFSLRTLLIATTLVAVVLGLIVYATRQ